MADNTESVPQAPIQGSPAAQATQGATGPTGAPAAEFTEEMDPRMATVRNMAELRQKSPKTYRATLESIAMRIIADCRRHRAKMKTALRSQK